jgi:hypothetical protein
VSWITTDRPLVRAPDDAIHELDAPPVHAPLLPQTSVGQFSDTDRLPHPFQFSMPTGSCHIPFVTIRSQSFKLHFILDVRESWHPANHVLDVGGWCNQPTNRSFSTSTISQFLFKPTLQANPSYPEATLPMIHCLSNFISFLMSENHGSASANHILDVGGDQPTTISMPISVLVGGWLDQPTSPTVHFPRFHTNPSYPGNPSNDSSHASHPIPFIPLNVIHQILPTLRCMNTQPFAKLLTN